MKAALLLLTAVYASLAAIQSDYVPSLPDFTAPLNFSIYSGLLSVPYSTEKQIHYVFLTKTGTTSTFNDAPVILWLNGGPGCSSLEGFLVENGPFVFEDGQEDLNGTFNIWSWNQFANVLYFESPPGVGFSPVTANGTVYNDSVTTQDNYYALVTFFSGFAELLQNQFWIAGESYAGIYVPYLATYIAEQNQLSTSLFMNLQGVMVGNGIGSRVNEAYYGIDFLYGHYLIPDSVYNQYYQYCPQNASAPECVNAATQISNLTALLNPYDIYRPCFYDDSKKDRTGWLFNRRMPISYSLMMAGTIEEGMRGSGDSCMDTSGIQKYLNRLDVKQALHVDPNIEFLVCNETVDQAYSNVRKDSVDNYVELMADGYKVLIYNGDTDSVVPYTTTLNWIQNLNLGVVNAWRPWYIGDQVRGFVQEFKGMTYATVKGAGHMVPQWKRQEAYVMISSFIGGQPLPYKTSSKQKEESIIS